MSSIEFDPTSQVPVSSIPIINWEGAMQQVGDDEEFLRELLNDLRVETDTQLNNVAAIIQVRSNLFLLSSIMYVIIILIPSTPSLPCICVVHSCNHGNFPKIFGHRHHRMRRIIV
jgi:hypothetical protein